MSTGEPSADKSRHSALRRFFTALTRTAAELTSASTTVFRRRSLRATPAGSTGTSSFSNSSMLVFLTGRKWLLKKPGSTKPRSK
jgi:hypothetical protein